MHTVYKMYKYNPINVITITYKSDTCFAIHVFFAITTCPVAPLTGLIITVYRAWETSHINLTTIRNINGMAHFINPNNTFNVYVDRNNASNILFTKKLLT